MFAWAAALLGAGCSAPAFDAKQVAMEWAAFMQRDYTLRPGDKLSILMQPTVAPANAAEARGGDVIQEVTVSPTGTIDVRELPGPLQVAGKTVGAVRTLVYEAYKTVYANPVVSVSLREAAVQSVYVFGEVFDAGPVPYQPGLTMTQAIAAAGSFNYTIKSSDVRILRIAPDGTQRTFRVNMNDVLLAEYPDFLLLPGDVVYCQTSTVADIGNLVDLYIRRMLPFSLVGPSVGTTGN